MCMFEFNKMMLKGGEAPPKYERGDDFAPIFFACDRRISVDTKTQLGKSRIWAENHGDGS